MDKFKTKRDTNDSDGSVFACFHHYHVDFRVCYVYMVFYVIKGRDCAEYQKLMEQTGESLEDYLVSMRQVSDTVYYNIIKESDFSKQKQEIQSRMNLLYEANKDNLRSIAIYNHYGSLLAAEPVASQKEDPDVTQQDWYIQALDEVENMHFSTPHIQNLFDDGTQHYYWVTSLSRMIEITDSGVSNWGVLLVDMDYADISRMMNQINTLNNGEYYYLCDSNGEIIYHRGRYRSVTVLAEKTAVWQPPTRTVCTKMILKARGGK